jgi:hypothetical protein
MKPYLRLSDGSDLKSVGSIIPIGTDVRIESTGCIPGQAFRTWRELRIYVKNDIASFVKQALELEPLVAPSDGVPEKLELI